MRAATLLKLYGFRVAPRLAAVVHRRLRRPGRAGGAHAGAPAWAREDLRLAEARRLVERARSERDLARIVDLAFASPAAPPNQNRSEILALVRLVGARRPRTLCEIGSAEGGTLFLLSRAAHPEARLLSIDVANTPQRIARFQALVPPPRHLTCIHGDSHAAETVERFRAWLGAERLDVLLIDGDHTADGVARDHATYGPAVAPGGLVAFHDIVPDFRTRYGVDTGTDAGGVPQVWARLRAGHAGAVREIVEHRLQDGRGIGVIEVPETGTFPFSRV
jgi:predicted O-methyltransferase YrrM